MPVIVSLGKKRSEVMVGAQADSLRITDIEAARDNQEFGIPSDGFSLVLQPTGTRDGVETQRVFPDEHQVFKTLFVDVNKRLNIVFLRREEEEFQIIKTVDDRMLHGVDGSRDAFPSVCGFVDVDVGRVSRYQLEAGG